MKLSANKKMSVVFLSELLFLVVAFFLCSCDFNMEGKNKCRTPSDCLDGRVCQKDDGQELGICVSVAEYVEADSETDIDTACNESCNLSKICFNNRCLKKCSDFYESSDCNHDETCSLLLQEDDTFIEEDDEVVSACITEDICWGDNSCPVGEVGSVCSTNHYPETSPTPKGCILKGCKDTSNCPSGWECLKMNAFYSSVGMGYNAASSELGFCSNGEEGHICRPLSSGDCNEELICGCENIIGYCGWPEARCMRDDIF
jgi:hypothetical protein